MLDFKSFHNDDDIHTVDNVWARKGISRFALIVIVFLLDTYCRLSLSPPYRREEHRTPVVTGHGCMHQGTNE